MSHYKDWRPHTLNVESLATDAQLTRIEAKLDLLLAREPISGWCEGHPMQHAIKTREGSCNVCGKPLKLYG